jgi:hypothetical protein
MANPAFERDSPEAGEPLNFTLCIMTDTELINFAEGWIAYWSAPSGSPEREALTWVWDQEYDLMQKEPEKIWRLILEVLHRNSSNQIQEVLSAGPLEDLLDKYGDEVIDKVENEAKSNPLFAQLLGGVWQGSMTNDIWSRVQAAQDRRGWDGIPNA